MKIKELLSNRSKWTQGEYARDSSGNSVEFDNENAICFCLFGAYKYCYPNDYDYILFAGPIKRKLDQVIEAYLEEIGKVAPHCELIYLNDNLGYEAVMAVVEKAGV